MAKLLVISYHFAPYNGVGGIRVRKLIKYFNELGWSITVITVKEDFFNNSEIDKNTLKDVPNDVTVIRTKRMNKFMRYNNPSIYWLKDLFLCMKKLIKNNDYDYIYYTGGPFLHWIVAPVYKKTSKIPYILDFRDPWSVSPYDLSKRSQITANLIEPFIIKHADFILNVTPEATNLYKSCYQKVPAKRFLTIPNGFDEDDFTKLEEIDLKKNGVTILYSGKFDSFRNPIPFLEALKEFNTMNDRKIYFVHVGKKEKAVREFIEKYYFMKKYIIETGYLTYKKALAYIKASDIGLIITGGHAYEPTTKIYDYIALDKYILSINDCAEGYLQRVLNDYNNGISVSNNKRDILNSLFKIQCNTNSCIDKKQFSRKHIFSELDSILKLNLYT